MAISKDQVKELLGTGLGPEVVASAVGCDVSYVSQLLSVEEFATEVAMLRTKNLASHTRRDASIDAVEDLLLSKLQDAVEGNGFYKPRDLLAAAATVNRMIRRGTTAAPTSITNVQQVIQLQLPEQVMRKYVTNISNEVVEVEGQTLVTMPAHMLLQKLADRGGEGEGRYKEAAKYLPSGLETTVAAYSSRKGSV